MALGKRKRSEDQPPATRVKRRKFSTGTDHDTKSHGYDSRLNAFSSIHLPAQKLPLSPLFHLPAELRNQIWQHAFGDLRICVDLISFNKRAEDSHKDLIYMLAEDLPYPFHNKFENLRLHLPPAVCKQFYAETTAAFYTSSTFEFTEPHTFRTFALSQHPCVPLVRHLIIPRLEHNWKNSLTPSLVGRLKNLRGVQLTHRYWRSIATQPLPRATHTTWKSFWHIIRAFQQHKLEAPSTRFDVVVYSMYKNSGSGQWAEEAVLRPGEAKYEDLLRLRREFTDGLLRYTPRRLSRRGAGGD